MLQKETYLIYSLSSKKEEVRKKENSFKVNNYHGEILGWTQSGRRVPGSFVE